MLAAIESTLPTAPLVYRVALTGKLHVVDDPGVWCGAHLASGTPEFICNGNEHELVSFWAVTISPHRVSGGGNLIQTDVDFPWTPAYIARVPDLFRVFGPAAGAYWGLDISGKGSLAIAKGAGRRSPDPGFPRPLSPSAAIPGRLAWVSYWSEETCRLLGFSPDDARASLFARVIPVEGHGVVLQLTDDLLDLDRSEHMAALTAAYAAFPAIDSKWGL